LIATARENGRWRTPHTSPRTTEPGVRERIQEAVDGLAEIYRTVFLMHDLEG
jgi:DNA-directed RNA polymerase specialized sigma24 family protein